MHNLTIIFDLDGTLVDTAPDLVAATNHALLSINLAPVEAEIIRPYVSFGARAMIDHALKVSGETPDGRRAGTNARCVPASLCPEYRPGKPAV